MIIDISPLGKALKFFYQHPHEEVYLREFAKKLKLSTFSAKKYLDKLVAENLITESRRGKMRFFKTNLTNPVMRYLKVAFNLDWIMKSNLIEFLKEKVPLLTSIVVYGSVARGEDTKDSDIDLLIIGKKIPLDFSEYERKLDRNITMLIYKPSEWRKKALENKGFYQNIVIDGIVIYGNMPVIE